MVQSLQLENLQQIYEPYREGLAHYLKWMPFDHDLTRNADNYEVVPATRLLEPEFLREKLVAYGQYIETTDLKVSASIWTKQYSIVLLPFALSAFSLGGLGIDFSLANLTLVFSKESGNLPECVIPNDLTSLAVLPSRCPVPALVAQAPRTVNSVAELHEIVLPELFGQNLALVVEALAEVGRVNRKIVWNNLGTYIFGIYHTLAGEVGSAAALEDRQAILGTLHNPLIVLDKNPVYQAVREVFLDDPVLAGKPVHIRAACCLWYKSPKGRLCNGCPLLKPAEMVERWKLIYQHGY